MTIGLGLNEHAELASSRRTLAPCKMPVVQLNRPDHRDSQISRRLHRRLDPDAYDGRSIHKVCLPPIRDISTARTLSCYLRLLGSRLSPFLADLDLDALVVS